MSTAAFDMYAAVEMVLEQRVISKEERSVLVELKSIMDSDASAQEVHDYYVTVPEATRESLARRFGILVEQHQSIQRSLDFEGGTTYSSSPMADELKDAVADAIPVYATALSELRDRLFHEANDGDLEMPAGSFVSAWSYATLTETIHGMELMNMPPEKMIEVVSGLIHAATAAAAESDKPSLSVVTKD